MKILNKRELQEMAFDHSSENDFKEVMNLDKKCTAKSYSFLVHDTMLASDNCLRFKCNLSRKDIKTNHDN